MVNLLFAKLFPSMHADTLESEGKRKDEAPQQTAWEKKLEEEIEKKKNEK